MFVVIYPDLHLLPTGALALDGFAIGTELRDSSSLVQRLRSRLPSNLFLGTSICRHVLDVSFRDGCVSIAIDCRVDTSLY
jgi:hypothetical protein